MAVHEFSSSAALKVYVRENDVYTRHGDVSLGTILFIDTSSLHIAFDTRLDYERWRDGSKEVQITLF